MFVSFDAAQDTVGFLGCKHTLLACVELYQPTHLSPLQSNSQPVHHQALLIVGITHMQDFAVGLAELNEVCTGKLLKLLRVSQDGISSFQHHQLHHTAWCCL